MSIAIQLAKHFRDVYFGGNWTVSDVKNTLADVDLGIAKRTIPGFENSILTLFCHACYFTRILNEVLQGKPLQGSDKESFILPELHSEQQWREYIQSQLDLAENTAALISSLDDAILNQSFPDEKYGTWYRNISGTIEHMHYHLGQIAMLKKQLKFSI